MCLNSGTSAGRPLRGWILVAALIAWSVAYCSAKLGRWHSTPSLAIVAALVLL